MSLPKWVIDNESSLRDEAQPYIGLSPQERAVMLAAACRAGAKLLRARTDVARLLARTDPLPEASELLLARLRALKKATDAASE